MIDFDPGHGDTEAIRSVAGARQGRADTVQAAANAVLRALEGDPDTWKGQSAEAARATATAIVRDLYGIHQKYQAHSRELYGYASGVDSIKSRAAAVSRRIDNNLMALDSVVRGRLYTDVGGPDLLQFFANVAGSLDRATNFSSNLWAVARRTIPGLDAKLDEIESARVQMAALREERDELDRRYADRLRVLTLPPSFRTVRELNLVGDDLVAYLLAYPAVLELLASEKPSDPNRVAALWGRLTPEQRRTVARAQPDIVGNLEGVPYVDRNVANQIRLKRDLALAQSAVSKNPGDADAKLRLEGLRAISAALGWDPSDEKPPRYLISYDLADRPPRTDQPLAAISYGNLDEADNATYLVPGMNTTATSMGNLGADAQAIYRAQQSLLGPSGSVAVVAWLGYATPDEYSVGGNEYAEAGAKRLAAALDGYAAVQKQAGHDTHLGVVAHSYGSTTAMLALEENHGVDSLVVFGSAGQVPDTKVDIPKDNFIIIKGTEDALAPTGTLLSGREDPASTGQGTSHYSFYEPYFDRDGRPVILKPAVGSPGGLGHDGYLEPGTSSLQDIAAGGLGIKAEDYR